MRRQLKCQLLIWEVRVTAVLGRIFSSCWGRGGRWKESFACTFLFLVVASQKCDWSSLKNCDRFVSCVILWNSVRTNPAVKKGLIPSNSTPENTWFFLGVMPMLKLVPQFLVVSLGSQSTTLANGFAPLSGNACSACDVSETCISVSNSFQSGNSNSVVSQMHLFVASTVILFCDVSVKDFKRSWPLLQNCF